MNGAMIRGVQIQMIGWCNGYKFNSMSKEPYVVENEAIFRILFTGGLYPVSRE